MLAVVLSLLGMMAYIWCRFEFRFGVGAMIASAHDVVVTLGLYALLGYEFNLTTIAAFLTLVGYSVNDTVVIFDRVRENMRKPKRLPLTQVINEGINETLSRTIMTASTTLLAVLALFLVGGDVLRGLRLRAAVRHHHRHLLDDLHRQRDGPVLGAASSAAKESAKPAAMKAAPIAPPAPRPKTSARRSSV